MSGRADRIAGSLAAAPFSGLPSEGHVVIFDLEITAWEGSLARGWSGPGEFMEVVQIGAVKLDAAVSMAELDCFDVLVQPVKNPVLSDYFTNLTGITNADLEERGLDFGVALTDFADFVGDAGMVISNGDDWSELEQNALWAAVDWPFPPGLFRNIRGSFSELLGIPRNKAVSSELPRLLGLAPVPGAHTGLGDSRAIAAAIRHLRTEGRF